MLGAQQENTEHPKNGILQEKNVDLEPDMITHACGPRSLWGWAQEFQEILSVFKMQTDF